MSEDYSEDVVTEENAEDVDGLVAAEDSGCGRLVAEDLDEFPLRPSELIIHCDRARPCLLPPSATTITVTDGIT